ncbi:MAG TPA: 2Fe-2S iron-sulfur cluster-binding protein, partial [Thermoplasmata archaeon]|nr:2Fe-2S iron-sulfur cluster-binding protein [Thermoplasmata archaeon]
MSSSSQYPPRLRGRSLEVRPGETLVQALARKGEWLLGRSIRYHRPRAPLCGVGACSQCLVRVNGQPNVRACRYSPVAGDRIEVENAWPNPRFDLWSVLDLAFYRGIDTLHGFRRPRFATPLYHRIVRRLAGVGRLAHPSLGGRPGTTHSVEVDVAVVGGGESGQACAERLRTGGRTVHVIDRGRAGGPRTLTSGHTVAFLPPPTADAARPFVLLGSREDGAGLLVHASKVVVATGGYDANLLFDGNDRPGVVTGDGAEALAGPDGSAPFRHAVLFGGSERTAELLDRFGERVEAIVAPGPIPPTIA